MNAIWTAAIWMVGAIVSFSMMAIAGRAISDVHSTFEIMFFRSCIGIVLVVATSGLFRRLTDIQTDRLGLHVVRNLSHFAGQNLWFFALPLIPFAQLFALEFTSPIWVLVFSPLFLGERLTAIKLFCALLGFMGVLVVVRPFGTEIGIGTVSAALAAIGFAGAAICTRFLTRHEGIVSILFWLTVMQAAFGLFCIMWSGSIVWPTGQTAPWLIAIGIAGLVAHYCLTTALGLAPAAVVMPIDFARLPVIAVIGAVFYAEGIEIWVLLGGAIIICANFINIRTESMLVAKR